VEKWGPNYRPIGLGLVRCLMAQLRVGRSFRAVNCTGKLHWKTALENCTALELNCSSGALFQRREHIIAAIRATCELQLAQKTARNCAQSSELQTKAATEYACRLFWRSLSSSLLSLCIISYLDQPAGECWLLRRKLN